MARSPLTLAASVTAALPRTAVVGAGPFTEGGAGRFDAAIVRLEDGRDAIVRTPADADSAADLAAESRALAALTPGVRALLPFRAPELLGETGSGAARVVVTDFLDGYRVDPPHVPKGPGAATAIGAALAAVHALPPSIVRTDGLPVRSREQVRDEVARLLDRVQATRRAPDVLLERWRRAHATDELWRFEPSVVLGGATSASFLLSDDGEHITVTGALEWGGLSVGDPATDLRWLASAPDAAADVYAGYVGAASRAPDALLRERARLYAELEFARWLVHGFEDGDVTVQDDAVALLDALADGVRGDRLVPDDPADVDAALAFVERLPEPAAPVDTSMQTDTYDPEMLSAFIASERDRVESAPDGVDFGLDGLRDPETQPTAPIDLTGWDEPRGRDMTADEPMTPARVDASDASDADDAALQDEAARATRAALRRWGGGDPRVNSGG